MKQTFTGRPKNLNTKEDPEIYPKAVRNTTSHANVRSRDCLTSGHRQEADPQHLKMQQQIDELNNNISLLQEENERITIENKKLVSIDTVDDIQKWTGLPNKAVFDALVTYFGKRGKNLKYWKGNSTARHGHFTQRGNNKPAPDMKLTLENEIFLTLVKLKI